MSFFVRAERRLYLKKKRARLKNLNPSIISNNCNSGIISHDMGLPFLSPTINMGFLGSDYMKFISNIDHYFSQPIVPIDSNGFPHLLGKCDDIVIIFAHTDDIEGAIKKWHERKKRINKDNLYIMMTDQPELKYHIENNKVILGTEFSLVDEEKMRNFDALPYQHKVLLTHVPHPEIKCSYYLKGFEQDEHLGILSDFKPGLLKRRWLDQFDYVSFLNGEGIKQ